MPLIVAVSGKLGSGKDYITENIVLPLLHHETRVSKMAFADHIKVSVASENNILMEAVLCGSKDPVIRKQLQIRGTEDGRDKYGPNIWVETLANWITLRQLRGDVLDVVLITDCRFPNEAKWIESQGGLLIRVVALDRHDEALDRESRGDINIRNSIAMHSSETALDDYKFANVVDNSIGATDVANNVVKIIRKFLNTNLNHVHLWNL